MLKMVFLQEVVVGVMMGAGKERERENSSGAHEMLIVICAAVEDVGCGICIERDLCLGLE